MNRVKEIREAQGLTQQQLAKLAGVTQPYLHDLEKNRRGARPETWARIAEALGVKVEELREVVSMHKKNGAMKDGHVHNG